MGVHLIEGEFQSDKYPTTPRGKVPLSVTDPTARDLLWEYAQRRRAVDAEFADDLEAALTVAGYEPAGPDPDCPRVALPSWTVAGARKMLDALYAAEAQLRFCARHFADAPHPNADKIMDSLRRSARAFVDAEDAIILWKVKE